MATRLNAAVSASALADLLGCALVGNDRQITGVGALSEVCNGLLTFTKSDLPDKLADGAVLIAPRSSFPLQMQDTVTILVSEHPRLAFVRALQILDASPGYSRSLVKSKIHPNAVIAPSAIIESGCIIDEGVVIEHNAVLYSGTIVGAHSRINAGAVVGRDGFGFERDAAGQLQKFVHLGGVKIGRNVEIGCNACVSRGALGMTTIEDGVKIDALVYVAHNCHIESDAIIIAGAELSGGVHVGPRVWVGPKASVMQKVSIGADSVIGLGAVVLKDVLPGSVIAGNPGRMIRHVVET